MKQCKSQDGILSSPWFELPEEQLLEQENSWSLHCAKPWHQLGAYLRALTINKGPESCREQLWWVGNEAAWSSLWDCLMSAWIAQMAHPFKLNFCVLLLDPLAVVLSSSQCFQVLPQPLGCDSSRCSFTPGSLSLGIHWILLLHRCFLGQTAVLDVCSVGTLERSPCEHQWGMWWWLCVPILSCLSRLHWQIFWSREEPLSRDRDERRLIPGMSCKFKFHNGHKTCLLADNPQPQLHGVPC